MQHLDEGTIHAWLDGALDAEETARVEQHAAECATCAAAVAEARGLVAGASRILTALDHTPGGVIPRPAPAASGGARIVRRRVDLRAVRRTRMMTVLRVAHVLSASIWVGGTVALVFIGVPAIRQLEGEARATAMRTLGRRWRPIGWSAMAVAILSGLWLTDRHGGFNRAALDTDFDRTLIAKSVLVALLVVGGLLHDYVLGPRLQRELRARDAAAPATRRRLVLVGWLNFGLTIAVPVMGAVVLSTLD
jgi:uncharacterized membrane protein